MYNKVALKEKVMDHREWVSKAAYYLWQEAGCPSGHDLTFWLYAEKLYCDKICIIAPGSCPFQDTQPTNGGRHISFCKLEGTCKNRASNYMRR